MTGLHPLVLESFHAEYGVLGLSVSHKMPIQYSRSIYHTYLDVAWSLRCLTYGSTSDRGEWRTKALEQLVPAVLQEMVPGRDSVSQ